MEKIKKRFINDKTCELLVVLATTAVFVLDRFANLFTLPVDALCVVVAIDCAAFFCFVWSIMWDRKGKIISDNICKEILQEQQTTSENF